MIRMVGGWVFLLVPAHPGSPGQRAVKWLLLCCWRDGGWLWHQLDHMQIICTLLQIDNQMLMQLWRPESELDGINSGSWYHYLPTGIYHWLGQGGCTAVVCKGVCYMEVRPGLSGKKTRWHFSEQRWEWSNGCVMLKYKIKSNIKSWERDYE